MCACDDPRMQSGRLRITRNLHRYSWLKKLCVGPHVTSKHDTNLKLKFLTVLHMITSLVTSNCTGNVQKHVRYWFMLDMILLYSQMYVCRVNNVSFIKILKNFVLKKIFYKMKFVNVQ